MRHLLILLVFSLFWSITCAESEKKPGQNKKNETKAVDTTGKESKTKKPEKYYLSLSSIKPRSVVEPATTSTSEKLVSA